MKIAYQRAVSQRLGLIESGVQSGYRVNNIPFLRFYHQQSVIAEEKEEGKMAYT